MSICFHPELFDDTRFAASAANDIFARIFDAIVPGKHYGWGIDGYDIIGYRVAESPYRPIGSIIDYVLEQFTHPATDFPQRTQVVELLGKLTERGGNLFNVTQGQYLGFLTAAEVVQLRHLLQEVELSTPRATAEKAALMKILAIAEQAGVGLVYSMA